jgi:phytoene dehydrogenase-like protein
MTQSISDFLDQYFESDQLKAVLAYYGSIGTFAGPKTPGTAYVLLHHLMGEHEGAGGWGFIRGGMGGISQAIARSAERHGAEVRIAAEVARVTVRGGRATGVVLASGEELSAKLVVSNADPKRTFLGMVDARELPPEFVDEIRSYRTYSTAFKINLALEEAPRYTAFDAAAIGSAYPTYVHIGPSMEYLERAYDDAKYGRPSARPFMSPVVPTIVDPELAPRGKHILNIFGGHAPYTLAGTTWDAERERFADTVIDTLAAYAPNLPGAVIHRQILMPPDLEAVFALPQGHIFHGELSLDQLFFLRPAAGYANYRSPVRGLYQCGSATHPGGGVMGVCGHNAAREILKDWKGLRA